MAANVIRFRAWLEGDLLIRAVLSLHMTDTEGLDSVESLANRTTSQIREDIKSMRRASHPAPPANNPNATIGVTARESMTIHRISKYGKYLVLVQRVHTPALGTIANLLFIGQFYDENQDLMEGDSYPLPPHPPKFNNRDGRIMMENIESWARTAYGYRGIRLDYIIRENSALPLADDPGFLRANDGSRSIEEELVRRAAHTGAVFRRNNQKFWVMLHAVTHETDAYNHVRQFAPAMNGRAAYLALFAQYRGRGHFTNERQAAVRVLATLHWNGKARGFTWNTFISRLIGAFNDLELNGDPRSDANKVDVLLEKTVGDSSLSNGRSHITGDAVLRSNFQGSIDYLTTQVLASGNDNTQRRNRQLAAFSRGGGRGGNDGRSGGRSRGNGASNRTQSNVPDRFSRNGILLNDGGYSNEIWRNEFTQEERNICLEMRRNRRSGGRGGRGREGRGGRGRGRQSRGIGAVHDGRADQDETKEEENENDGRGAGAGMSRQRRGPR